MTRVDELTMNGLVFGAMVPQHGDEPPLHQLPDNCAAVYSAPHDRIRQQGLFATLVAAPIHQGAACFVPRPAAEVLNAMPPVATAMLRIGGQHVVCAGGRVLGAVICDADIPGADTDLWIVDASTELRRRLAAEFVRVTTGAGGEVTATPKALTSRVGGDIVQLILFEAIDTADILQSFDMLPCRVALEKVECAEHLSMNETDWRVVAPAGWQECVVARMFPVLTEDWRATSVQRLAKYALSKGFVPYVPGMLRSYARARLFRGAPAHLRAAWAGQSLYGQLICARGVQKALVLESLVFEARRRGQLRGRTLFHVARSELMRVGDFVRDYSAGSQPLVLSDVPQLQWRRAMGGEGAERVELAQMHRELVVPPTFMCACGQVIQRG